MILRPILVAAATAIAPTEATDAPKPSEKPPPALVGVVGGAVIGDFFGLPNTRGQVGVAVVRPVSDEPFAIRFGLDWQPGSTEYGLQIHRLAASIGLETVGRLRLGGGIHVPYAFVLRKTERSPFMSALFGDIGGFGLGAHASLWVDVVRAKRFTLMLGVRGDYETYFTGTSRQASASLGIYF